MKIKITLVVISAVIAIAFGSLKLFPHKIEVANKLLKPTGIVLYDKNGNTPLIASVAKNDVDNIKKLLREGADINQFDKRRWLNPLFVTIINQGVKDDVAKVLLENGADVNLSNKDGFSALTFLAASGPKKIGIAQLLIDHGADVNKLTNAEHYGSSYSTFSKDESPLQLCIGKTFTPPLLAELLIKNGADIFIKDKNQSSLLFHVYDIKLAKYLLNNNLDPNARNDSGETILHYIVQFNKGPDKEKFIKLLLEYKTDINALDQKGRTPLDCTNDLTLKAFLKKNGAISNASL
ncbi:MAG: hypothetical protein GY707_01785 [Desulfobacteraceae bacterium]|nr:hypothetical protein [Desulfobacteraceae bacterium]